MGEACRPPRQSLDLGDLAFFILKILPDFEKQLLSRRRGCAFGIKLEWVVRRGGRRSLLVWDLLDRGSLLALGVGIALEMVLVVAGEPAFGIPSSVGNILAAIGMAVSMLYLLLERPLVRKQLLQIGVTSTGSIVTLVPILEYRTPPGPAGGESWRRVAKPEDGPSVRDEPSNRRYSANR